MEQVMILIMKIELNMKFSAIIESALNSRV